MNNSFHEKPSLYTVATHSVESLENFCSTWDSSSDCFPDKLLAPLPLTTPNPTKIQKRKQHDDTSSYTFEGENILKTKNVSRRLEKCASKLKIPIKFLSPAAWRGVMRNVPASYRDESRKALAKQTFMNTIVAKASSKEHVILISRSKPRMVGTGRILVLVGLKYRGNVGSIVRSAVQANAFDEIYYVENRSSDEEYLNLTTLVKRKDGKTGEDESEHGIPGYELKTKKRMRVTDKEVDYFSIFNAPLIPFRRFKSVGDFMSVASNELVTVNSSCNSGVSNIPNENLVTMKTTNGRVMVALECCDSAFDIEDAKNILAKEDLYLVMGAEDIGVPMEIMNSCSALVKIPALSASVNVSCAFSAVLTILKDLDYNK